MPNEKFFYSIEQLEREIFPEIYKIKHKEDKYKDFGKKLAQEFIERIEKELELI